MGEAGSTLFGEKTKMMAMADEDSSHWKSWPNSYVSYVISLLTGRGVYSRAAFIGNFQLPSATFNRGLRLFEGGV